VLLAVGGFVTSGMELHRGEEIFCDTVYGRGGGDKGRREGLGQTERRRRRTGGGDKAIGGERVCYIYLAKEP